MAPFEALYGRKCRSPLCWNDSVDAVVLGPEMLEETAWEVALIKKRMLAAQSRQKAYADPKRREVVYNVGDHVLVKVSPTKGVFRFGKKGKLNPRYIGPFEVLEKIGEVAYRIALPPALDQVHNVFHVSLLKEYRHDSAHVLDYDDIEVRADVRYVEEPVRILEHRVKQHRNKTVPLVRILRPKHGEDAECTTWETWETESEIRKRYPQLFES